MEVLKEENGSMSKMASVRSITTSTIIIPTMVPALG
jgi:hypothetical protein